MTATYLDVAAAYQFHGGEVPPDYDGGGFSVPCYEELITLDVSNTPQEDAGPDYRKGQAARARVRVYLTKWLPLDPIASPQVFYVTKVLRDAAGIT